MTASILKLILLCVELGMMLFKRYEREEHEKRVAEIKSDPRAVFIRKFGGVPGRSAAGAGDLFDSHPPAIKRDGERNIVE